MNNATVRQQLNHIIDVADDANITALYNFYQGNLMSNEKFSTTELAEFYSRLTKYENGTMPVYTVDEAHNYVRTAKK